MRKLYDWVARQARWLYDWTLHWAHTPYGAPALFGLAVVESSVFPVPPDPLLIALGLGRRQRAFWYALVCSVGSVLGGVIGYWIGYAAWETTKDFFIPYLFSQAAFDRVGEIYQSRSFWFIFIAAFTPIPYKVFTIAAGVYHEYISLWILIGASLVGRSARFFLVSALLYRWGELARRLIERYFDRLLWAFVALGVLGYVAVKFL